MAKDDKDLYSSYYSSEAVLMDEGYTGSATTKRAIIFDKNRVNWWLTTVQKHLNKDI